MAIVIRKKARVAAPEPLVANDDSGLFRAQQLVLVKALARDHAKRDHALAQSQRMP
jgi:hypothetical protein